MKKFTIAASMALFILVMSACKKLTQTPPSPALAETLKTEGHVMPLNTSYCYSCGIIDSMPATDFNSDSIERPTILGMQHVNPYLIPNMRNAYAALGLSSSLAVINNLYVRFLPSSPEQFGILDSIMDAQGLDLFDAPMDYDILQEGDYYQDPSIPAEQVSYQYAVVPPSFQFPSGITYTILAQIHIPDDNYTAVETEAERRAAVQDSLNSIYAFQGIANPDNIECQAGYHYDPETRTCVRDNCQPGYHWGGTQCVPNCSPGYYWNGNTCVPIGVPPPPAPDAAIPAGNIAVSDVNLGTTPGVRNTRIVVKRWFKIQRLYTDNNGHFQASKHFKHKVKIVVKFKNSFADLKGARGIRLWQMWLPISKTIGVYRGNKSNINYTFIQYPNGVSYVNNQGNQLWSAATILNAIQEHKDYATQMGFTPAPQGLRILLSGKQANAGAGSTVLFGARTDFQQISSSFASVFLYGGDTNLPGGWTTALLTLSGIHVDMTLDYAAPSSIRFSDDNLKQLVYHEMSHASHYAYAGKTFYTNFVNSELSEISIHPNDNYTPYGTGSDSYAGIIAFGEAWANHMGFYLANQKYNVEPGVTKGDISVYVQENQANRGTDLVSLENFSPVQSGDPFHRIPTGLILDLIDVGENTPLSHVTDPVSGYTIQEIFSALQPDVTSIPQHKARLIQLYGTAQQSQVNTLFASYGY
jgi:hypothetical protein